MDLPHTVFRQDDTALCSCEKDAKVILYRCLKQQLHYAHACGEEVAAFQAAGTLRGRCGKGAAAFQAAGTRRSGPHREPYNTGGMSPAELYDAHACGKVDVAFQATRTRRSGSLCEP